MARMKIEFTGAYKRRHGHTLKDKLVASCPTTRAWASRWPGC
jgi:hypothetical protein